MHISDGFGRRFSYLRLSLTDACNFRCSYCLPEGYKKCGGPGPLSNEELMRAARAFSDLGIAKIRLTGGEPTIRRNFDVTAASIAALPKVKTLALTTNGYRLRERAVSWRKAGIDALNVSLDSLDPDTFLAITGHDRCIEVQQGIEAALIAGFSSVKVNIVYMKGVNDHEVDRFIKLTQDLPISVRFIELMETGDHAAFFRKHHAPVLDVARQLTKRGWTQRIKAADAGPSLDYVHPDHAGSIGFIAPYSEDFCKTCNRLRFSSQGDLHLCLFGTFGIPMRRFLQADDQIPELKQRIVAAVRRKSPRHFLHQGETGQTHNLSAIGG